MFDYCPYPDQKLRIYAVYVESRGESRAVVDYQRLPEADQILRPSRGVSNLSDPRYECEPSLLYGPVRVSRVRCVLLWRVKTVTVAYHKLDQCKPSFKVIRMR